MNIDCPHCGRRVALDADNRIPYHDSAPPLRGVCSASRRDATRIVAILKNASVNLSHGDLVDLAAERGMRLVATPHVLDVEAARKAGAVAEREACALIARSMADRAGVSGDRHASHVVAAAEAIEREIRARAAIEK